MPEVVASAGGYNGLGGLPPTIRNPLYPPAMMVEMCLG
jgi:hypothetical protein